MNWDDIKIFLAIADHGGLKKAARSLGIHHTSCARRINTLESELGVKLFDRLTAGYQLTQNGEQLMRSAEQIRQGFNTIDREIAGKDLRIEGELSLTLPNGLASHLLMPDIHAFMSLFPGIKLKLIMSYTFKDLASREADVAIRSIDNPVDSLTGRRVGRIYHSAYASAEYLATHDLQHQPATCHWLGWGEEKHHLKWPGKAAYPHIPVRADMYSDVLQTVAAQQHMGIASLPCYIGDQVAGLQRIPNVSAQAGEWLWVLAHKDMAKNARVRALIEFLTRAFANHKAILQGHVSTASRT